MKGVILAGGTGSRLAPLTKVTNKHLLPIYDKPMIYYPIMKLKEMGVDTILLVSGRGHAGHFLELLGGGSKLGVNLAYEVQEEAGGIAQALSLAEDFVGDQRFVVMLGDNIYEDTLNVVEGSEAHVYLKEVESPESYGVAQFEGENIVGIVEKPSLPPSNFAVTGCYVYEPAVFDVIKTLKPSGRGELEISDVNNHYVKKGTMTYSKLKGFWGDCGESIDRMIYVGRYIQEHAKAFNQATITELNSS